MLLPENGLGITNPRRYDIIWSKVIKGKWYNIAF
jgi:hypothetical protein